MTVQYNSAYQANWYNRTTASDAATYTFATAPAAGENISSTKLSDLAYWANTERYRRTSTPYLDDSYTSNTGVYSAWLYNNFHGSMATAGYGWGGTIPYVDASTTVTAQQVVDMVAQVAAAASVCLCNCNYCTCNCNYCTCNCNYACTCNCNYSDKRLKANVKLLGTFEGVKVYSFNYLWDKQKTYVGVIAQDLIGTEYACALDTDENGYYVVDYSKLPVRMMEIK